MPTLALAGCDAPELGSGPCGNACPNACCWAARYRTTHFQTVMTPQTASIVVAIVAVQSRYNKPKDCGLRFHPPWTASASSGQQRIAIVLTLGRKDVNEGTMYGSGMAVNQIPSASPEVLQARTQNR